MHLEDGNIYHVRIYTFYNAGTMVQEDKLFNAPISNNRPRVIDIKTGTGSIIVWIN